MKIVLVLLLASVAFTAGKTFRFQQNGLDIVVNDNFEFQVFSEDGTFKVKGKFTVKGTEEPTDCSNGNELCIQVGDEVVRIFPAAPERCSSLISSTRGPTCFEYGDAQWFGGPERTNQLWPIQELVMKNEAYYIKEAHHQAVVEAYWLSSNGASLYVDVDLPLFVDSNNLEEGQLCLYTSNTNPYHPELDQNLTVTVCQSENARAAQELAIENFLGHATDVVDQRMSHEPIWSTWARYRRPINETIVTTFADEILQYGFNNSQIEIDDLWEPCYGVLDFDTNKFPNLKIFIQSLKDKGFRVTVWVHPFVDVLCQPAYNDDLANGRLVLNVNGSPLTTWWNGIAGHVDLSNSTTRNWYTDKLRKLVNEYGIDSFKFDAGESSFLPQPDPQLDQSIIYPDQFPIIYVDLAKEFGSFIEARVGRKSQDRSVFLRMIDLDSRWGLNNGLQSLITTLLQFNIAGYSYVLPDMIGGNVYIGDSVTKELFIRWLQANVLMPALQFSVVPWDFDDETIEISHQILNLRSRFYDVIDEAILNHTKTGAPVNAPIWWLSPTNEDALRCKDEYLLGERLLVAPVVENGARSRDIFLPDGSWQDVTRENSIIITGPTWLRNYTVSLAEVPVFENVANKKD